MYDMNVWLIEAKILHNRTGWRPVVSLGIFPNREQARNRAKRAGEESMYNKSQKVVIYRARKYVPEGV